MIINTQIKGGGGSGHYIDKEPDANGKLVKKNPIDLTGIRDLGDEIFVGARKNSTYTGELFVNATELTTISGTRTMVGIGMNSRITSMTLPNLVSITGSLSDVIDTTSDAPWYASGLQTLNLPALTTISGEKALKSFCWNATALTNVDLSSLTTISGDNACEDMFSNCTGLTSATLSSLTTISGAGACGHMFSNTGLTNVDLSSLTTISGDRPCGYMFSNCTGLISVYLPKITTSPSIPLRIPSATNMFSGSGLQILDLRNLQYVGDYGILDNILNGTNYLTTVNVNSLEHIGTEAARAGFGGASVDSSTMSDIFFPMLTTFGTNPFYSNAFSGRKNLTIHFRKDIQATVEALANYSTMWGAGTGSSVVFDLAGTLTGADSNSYTRSEIDSVYASETAGAAKTATGWKYNNTVYYTSGGSEPSVSDTIYSDSACTTAVTTISSIA